MYARHFGLTQPPFSIAPDPRYLFMSERHREALAHLLYGVRGGGGGFVVLTGDIGAGKTTVCRCLLEQLPARCNVAYIFNPKLTVEELLKSICAEFRIPARHTGPGVATVKDYVDALNEYLLRTHAVQQNNVLIIDEAQNLSADVLEQLRLLTNLETHERKLLQIVLIGQPELRTMLAKPTMQQLAQRVIARYHLGALTESETAQYVQHRLAVAGLTKDTPFDAPALRRVHRHARGVPRRINLLCDRALLGAYAKGKSSVDAATLEKAALEVFDAPDRATTRRAGYERPALIGVGLVLGALVVGGLTYGLQVSQRETPVAVAAATPSASEPAAGAASASAASASSPAAATPAPPPAPEIKPFDLPSGFAALLGPERAAWQALAPEWGVTLADGDPCLAVQKQLLRCFRSSGVTLATIRQLDRPGVLTLRDADNRIAHVVLTGLTADRATLRIGGELRSVPLVALADYWRGEFATLWRVPPEYRGTITDSRSGPSAQWLAQQLAAARGDKAPVRARFDDATLKGWIHTFQLTQGLPSDGIAGPVTLMQLNRTIGVDEPRLLGSR
jgi:general secretion pathway protein A